MDDVKIVVLESPYDTFPETRTQEFFGKSVGLRIKGYKSVYGYGVFPLDVSDFIGAHIMVCKQVVGGLRAVSTHKIVTHSRCQSFNVPFPALGLAKSSNDEAHTTFIEEEIAAAKRSGSDLSYLASWTVDPELKTVDRPLCAQIKELLLATIVNYHRLHGIQHGVVGGNLRYKTDRMSETWGYRYGTHQGQPLPSFGTPFLFGAPVALMRLEKFSDYAQSVAEKYQGLWESRLTIAADPGEQPIKKAA